MTANVPHRRKEDRFPGRVLGFFHRFFFVIGVMASICVVFLFLTLSRMINYTPPSLPDKILLTYTFKSGLAELVSKPSLDQPLLRPAATLHEVVTALDAASKDPRVKGFAAKMEDVNFSIAQVQELRQAVERFRKSGKFALVYSDTFGGLSSGMADYYLASAFGEVWLQPVGMVAVNGVAMEVPFIKGLFDKVGVSAQFGHKGIYKSAPESFTATGMSRDNREMMESLVGDLSAQIVADIAAARGMTPARFKKDVDEAPFGDAEALKRRLVDRIGYYDEMVDAAKARVKGDGDEADPVELLGYSFLAETTSLNKGIAGFVSKFMRKEAPPSAHKDKAKIALIFGAGDIVPYGGKTHAAFSEGGMSADKIVAAFKSAQKDDDVAAIVFRVDSPGGAPSAAETIRRVILETKKKGKPVVVSMSGYAASGGYWIAAPADRIVAQPGTITGSIGVFGGKFVLEGLWDKLGVNWDGVSRGKSARMWSANRPFSPEEYAKFDAALDGIYDAFLKRVMEGRRMTHDQAEAVAEGRVFTGRQAKENGLVDALGGLDEAVRQAKKLAKLDDKQDVPVVRFPPRKSTLELFISLATEGAFFKPDIQISAEDILAALPAGDMLKAPEIRVR